MGGGASYYPPMHACMHVASPAATRSVGRDCTRDHQMGSAVACPAAAGCAADALSLSHSAWPASAPPKVAVPVRGTDNHTKKAVLPYEHAMRARDLSGRVGGRSCASGPTVSELSFFLSFMQCLPSRLAIVGPSSTFVDATQRLASFWSATPARELDSHCSLHW